MFPKKLQCVQIWSRAYKKIHVYSKEHLISVHDFTKVLDLERLSRTNKVATNFAGRRETKLGTAARSP